MYKVNELLRAEILEYIKTLHPAARGSFEAFRQLSGLKKKTFQFLYSLELDEIEAQPDITVTEVLDIMYRPSPERQGLELGLFIFASVILFPLMVSILMIVLPDIFKRKLIWSSHLDTQTLMVLGALASVI